MRFKSCSAHLETSRSYRTKFLRVGVPTGREAAEDTPRSKNLVETHRHAACEECPSKSADPEHLANAWCVGVCRRRRRVDISFDSIAPTDDDDKQELDERDVVDAGVDKQQRRAASWCHPTTYQRGCGRMQADEEGEVDAAACRRP